MVTGRGNGCLANSEQQKYILRTRTHTLTQKKINHRRKFNYWVLLKSLFMQKHVHMLLSSTTWIKYCTLHNIATVRVYTKCAHTRQYSIALFAQIINVRDWNSKIAGRTSPNFLNSTGISIVNVVSSTLNISKCRWRRAKRIYVDCFLDISGD